MSLFPQCAGSRALPRARHASERVFTHHPFQTQHIVPAPITCMRVCDDCICMTAACAGFNPGSNTIISTRAAAVVVSRIAVVTTLGGASAGEAGGAQHMSVSGVGGRGAVQARARGVWGLLIVGKGQHWPLGMRAWCLSLRDSHACVVVGCCKHHMQLCGA